MKEYRCETLEALDQPGTDPVVEELLNKMAKSGWTAIGIQALGVQRDRFMFVFTRDVQEGQSNGYQTRRHSGELRYFDSLNDAVEDAKDPEVWKISFAVSHDTRVRLVRSSSEEKFYFDPIDLTGAGV